MNRRTLHTLGLALAALLVFAAVSIAPADDSAAERLARELAAETADARQAAEDALVALGEAARSVAEARLHDDDAEVRRRSRSVIARLDAALAAASRDALTWAGLRGNSARSGVAGGELPLTDPERIWSVRLPDMELIQGALVPGDGRLVVLSGDGIVRCFDPATGARMWIAHVEAQIPASAVLAAGRLIVPTERGIVALDETTGRRAWERPATYGCNAAPAVSGGRVYVAFRNEGVRAFDVVTGQPVFESSFAPSGALLVDGDLVVAGTEDGHIVRLHAETGKRLWRIEIGSAPNMGPTLAGPGMIAVLARDRYLRIVGAERGRTIWERRLLASSRSESLAAAAGRLYLTDDRGVLRAYDAGTGHADWQRDEGMMEIGGPCATASSVLWSARGRITCRNADDGRLRWRLDLRAQQSTPPVARDSVLYVLTDEELVALR